VERSELGTWRMEGKFVESKFVERKWQLRKEGDQREEA